MNEKVRILIVEDEAQENEAWSQAIERYNTTRADGFSFEAIFTESYEEAASIIEEQNIDAAVVDIRLKKSGNGKEANNDGDEVRRLLSSSEVAVVGQISGEPGVSDIGEDEQEIVKCFVKADSGEGERNVHEQMLDWFSEQVEFIKVIKATRRTIKAEMARLFKVNIWPRWKFWTSHITNEGDSFVSGALARHVVSHISTVLSDFDGGNAHPEEWYFVPPVSTDIQTGDIVREGEEFNVVVTPRCDLENPKDGGSIHLAKCEEIRDWFFSDQNDMQKKIAQYEEKRESASDEQEARKAQEKIDKAWDKFRKTFMGHNGQSFRHFLPEMRISESESYGPFFVRFDRIESIPWEEGERIDRLKRNRIGTITPEFLPSLVERLGGYFSRIGTPDYSYIE